MVRFVTFFVILLGFSRAFASPSLKVDFLVRTVKQSTDLREVHSSLNELYNTSTSTTAAGGIREYAAEELAKLGAEAAGRVRAHRSGARIAEDLLSVHMSDLGKSEKTDVNSIESMIIVGDERMKLAAIIFLGEHFSGRTPYESYFPLRPAAHERPVTEWETGFCLWGFERIPRILSRISFEASQKEGTEFGRLGRAAYKKIMQVLFEAANDVWIDPQATKETRHVRLIRQRLATKYLDELAQIAENFQAARRIRTPAPTKDHDGEFKDTLEAANQPEPRPLDAFTAEPAPESNEGPDFEGPVINCEGEMVNPSLNSIKSTARH